MKILHLVSQDSGGAGRAALRIHKALLNEHIDSIVLVQQKTTDQPGVMRLAKTKKEKIIEKIRPLLPLFFLLPYPQHHRDIFSPNPPSNRHLIKTILSLKPDLIHLHWINNGFLNIKDLAKINIPMLWSLHDANPYTGGCHIIPNECENFKTHCQKCPFLHSNSIHDLSYFIFNKKAKIYPKLNLTINGLSKWITDCAKQSMLLKEKKIINLPNCIDTQLYQPIPKSIAREILNLQSSKKIISFGAIDATSIDRKGYHQLKKALSLLKNKENFKLVIFGASQGESIEGIETLYLGHLSDDISLKILYNASDVFVTPSLAENLSNVIMESLACGVPVVGFDIGGNSDMIEHKTNGYLARDHKDLADGIKWVLDLEQTDYDTLCKNARKKICTKFDSNIVSLEYIKTYKEILND
ncbi:hypothetical protein BKH42_05010 [Helicobacter sp. 13S00482-2]|uniref:glycosyltransferase family 4 protein n=1 Tax=Helicobacter sp. 13S00482-2 TaxID=1476200 RepID=UPI000BA5ECCE|nr:glycosyltransferase family 4 protein [Helicobacter sp. 13S00482-2]PAF53680.1 hypothetical protein BKH42_05010 [Helicobacter sp. 13S00482-2]